MACKIKITCKILHSQLAFRSLISIDYKYIIWYIYQCFSTVFQINTPLPVYHLEFQLRKCDLVQSFMLSELRNALYHEILSSHLAIFFFFSPNSPVAWKYNSVSQWTNKKPKHPDFWKLHITSLSDWSLPILENFLSFVCDKNQTVLERSGNHLFEDCCLKSLSSFL